MSFRVFHLAFLAFATRSGFMTSAEDSMFRIIDGRKATTLEFPYQISIEVNGQQWCGGSIINENFVVTAAHCLKWLEKYPNAAGLVVVRAGHDWSAQGGSVYEIKEFIVHELYVDQSPIDEFDVALLKMAKPFNFTDRIQPIPLSKETPKEGQLCWVTGYGLQDMMRSTPSAYRPRHLMAVELPIISLPKCRTLLDGVAGDMICAGHSTGNKDACRGDSGGPLACNGQLSGIIAWGIGCGREGLPGVYTNSAKYIKWFEDKMADEKKKA